MAGKHELTAQNTFDFSDKSIVPVVEVDVKQNYRRRLMDQVIRDIQTVQNDWCGPEGEEFYEQRILAYRMEIADIDNKTSC